MFELTFRNLDEVELRQLDIWFQDAELRRRIQPPTPLWFNYVSNTPGCYAWMVYDGDVAIGQLQLDTYADNTGSIGLVVNPQLRNQGHGKRILRSFLQRSEVTRLERLEVTIEPDNIASLRCFHKAGFIQVSSEPDGEGFLHFAYNCAQSERPT
jgi:RimJ/RimL family protein N-acetyltransferase